MRKFLARRGIRAFGAHYDYDVDYMLHMLDISVDKAIRFSGLAKMTATRASVPARVAAAAKLVGSIREDCGPCVQLGVKMAQESGLADDQIRAVLTGDRAEMSDDTACAWQFATALVAHAPDLDSAREAVRSRWGDGGVLDLTLATQISRVFPMVKVGLGHGQACQRVQVSNRPVEVSPLPVAGTA